MNYTIECADEERRAMFYSDSNADFSAACVGYLRMDFGMGNEFWSTWHGSRNDLNDNVFKQELDDVINGLRNDGLLKSRNDMLRYCREHKSLALDESFGFEAETENHVFLLRCLPRQGYYDCYCYGYNKQELQNIQSQDQGQEMSL